MIQTPVVYLVDDDPSVTQALLRLFRVAGYQLKSFSNAHDFLELSQLASPSCLVLDVNLPDMNGPDIQKELKKRGWKLPIIFISGHGSIPMAVEALREGAVHFLPKPFDNQELLATVNQALQRESREHAQQVETQYLKDKIESLTPRELEVFLLAGAGVPNKNIASRLGISLQTVKFHRGHVMVKLQIDSVAELALLAKQATKLRPNLSSQ